MPKDASPTQSTDAPANVVGPTKPKLAINLAVILGFSVLSVYVAGLGDPEAQIAGWLEVLFCGILIMTFLAMLIRGLPRIVLAP